MNEGNEKSDPSHQNHDPLPPDLRQAELQNAEQIEQDLGVEEEPVQQHLEKPRRYRVQKSRRAGS